MATINAVSHSYADVAAAIVAASAGDIVIVPAGDGTETWSTQLVIDKAITLQGPGKALLTITSGVDGTTYLWKYAPATGTTTPFRLTGFAFDFVNTSPSFWLHNSASQYAITNVRVDHCDFLNCIHYPTVLIDGPVYGVIDHNTFTGSVHFDNLGQDNCNDWLYQPFALGSVNNLYWEDNDITTDYTICTGGWGGRYVYRHNAFTYTHATDGMQPAFDMHGNLAGGIVGARGGEIYSNTLTSTHNRSLTLVDQRGGIMVVFNNSVDNTFQTPESKCREEIDDDLVCGGLYTMYVNQSYYWSNTYDGNPIGHVTENTVGVDHPVTADADFWVYNPAFDGSSGIGVGLLAARPNSGLSIGVGYWATDESKLYRATSATTWELYYTPYTYPHPLTSGSNPWVMIYG
jgi:hypothetical protein